jgi:hypothetical protein
MQTIQHIDTIDGTIPTRVIVAHPELNAPFVSDFIGGFACRPTLQKQVTAPACFSSRSADGDHHRVRTIGADPLLPEPKELPCRFVKQSSPRSPQPLYWLRASPQAALRPWRPLRSPWRTKQSRWGIVTAIIITAITIMAGIIIGIMAGTMAIIIMVITIITATTTTVTTTTSNDKPADSVGRLTTRARSPSIRVAHAGSVPSDVLRQPNIWRMT